MHPRYSQSSRENATPSRGTSPLPSYKEVTPSPRGVYWRRSYSLTPIIIKSWVNHLEVVCKTKRCLKLKLKLSWNPDTTQGIRNPTKDWNPESRFHRTRLESRIQVPQKTIGIQNRGSTEKDWNPEPGIWKPRQGIHNPRLSCDEP